MRCNDALPHPMKASSFIAPLKKTFIIPWASRKGSLLLRDGASPYARYIHISALPENKCFCPQILASTVERDPLGTVMESCHKLYDILFSSFDSPLSHGSSVGIHRILGDPLPKELSVAAQQKKRRGALLAPSKLKTGQQEYADSSTMT